MNTLPYGLRGPLHYTSVAWLLLPIVALAAAAIWWWLRRRKERPLTVPGTGRPARRDGSVGATGLIDEIEALRERVLQNQNYRNGCHDLAFLLREHFTRRRGHHLLPLTAREVAARLGDATIGRLFELLADLQFRRSAPSQEDFEGICHLASESAGGKQT